MRQPRYKTRITPARMVKLLLTIVMIILVANLVSIYIKYVIGHHHSFFHVFYFNAEGNIPTLYSFVTVLMCAFILWRISTFESVIQKKGGLFWKMMALIFVFLAVDELIGFHETLTDNGREIMDGNTAGGYLHFAWVIPYCAFFAVVMAVIARSFFRLPNRTKLIFTMAGIIFFTGAVGMEMVSGRYINYHGDEALKTHLNYALLTTLEELLEMIAIIIFLYGLSEYYLDNVEGGKVKLKISFQKNRAETVNPRAIIPSDSITLN